MATPSAASSSAHPPQHFDRRNEPAPQMPIYNNSETRQKIVEILASTANGCLAELGYFPGMPHKLKELELQNKNWQTENVKLFEDNKRLMAMLNAQTESLKWMKVPDLEKIQRIKDLESENQTLRDQREELLRRSLPEGSQPPQQGQVPYAQLQFEHANLLDTYRLAYNEVQRLRAFISQNPHLHQQGPIRIEQQHPTSSQNLPQFPMPVPTQVPHQALAQQVQGPQRPTPSSVTNLPMFQPTIQGRRHDLPHAQNAVVQGQQQAVGMPRRTAPGTILIPPRPIQSAQTQPVRSPIQPSSENMPMQGENQPVMMENISRTSKRGSKTYPKLLPQAALSRSSSSSASLMGSAPSPPVRSPLAGQPINAQSHSAPPIVPTHGPPVVPSVRSPSTAPPILAVPTPPTSAILPHGTDLNQLMPSLPSPVIASPQNVPGPSNQSEPASTPAVVPSPAVSLKRDSISDQGVEGLSEEPNKKPRLEYSHPESGPTGPTAGPSSASLPEPPTEIPVPMLEVEEPMQVDEGDGSEEEIEVGPDGLRLVKDCLAEIFHEPKEDGSVICKLCEYRHTHGYQEEPPVQFVNPTDQQLEDHCVTEHEAAWSNLRNPDAE